MKFLVVIFVSLSQSWAEVPMPSVELVDGLKIPILGLGTYEMTDNQTKMNQIMSDAIDAGYRHIDTAYVYQNEALIGKALKNLIDTNKINRKDLFITSKVWHTYHRRSAVVESIKLSLNNLRLDYLDLALVHWPIALKPGTGYLTPLNENNQTIDDDTDIVETWKGMEDVYRLGLAKSIGISNFNSEQLNRVLKNAFLKPAVNQIEVHPYLTQEKLVDMCRDQSIQVVAYCPIGKKFQKELFVEPVLVDIANKYQKTVPQVMLRWLIQRNIIAIPKTSKKERLLENLDVFDFQLTDNEMKEIFKLNKNRRIIDPKVAVNNKGYPFAIPFK